MKNKPTIDDLENLLCEADNNRPIEEIRQELREQGVDVDAFNERIRRTLAELVATTPRKAMTPERVREICGDPCGSVFVSPDPEAMKEQLMRKSQKPVQPSQREGGG